MNEKVGVPESQAPPRAPASDPVTARLMTSRVELLDLSLRNPLLNYRPSRRRGVDIVDEHAAQIFSWLVMEGAPLRFHHTKEAPQKVEDGVVVFEEEGSATTAIGTGQANAPNSLATPYTRETMAHRLLETYHDARLSLEEQGANTLYLAIGMLRWREVDQTQDRWAPLVLVPVRLDRKSARSFWQLSAADEDIGVNLSLVEKLKQAAIKIPAEPPLETVEDLERFFSGVQEAVSEKQGWRVERDHIVLGFFSFGKFLMYRDLDPALWPADRPPARHEILSGLLLDGFRDRGSPISPGATMDEHRPPGKTMEVMDSDSSQAEALAEVAAGKNLVIQGPPGTGKSQTISNLIAEAVFAGKTVLFVAEKMAALEVVKRRLDNVGLGDLCLELHSNKSSKKDAAADLSRTLALGKPQEPEGRELVESLPSHRDRLNRYARAASKPVGLSGLTPYAAVGMLERLRNHPEPLLRIDDAPMADWTKARFDQALTQVQDLVAKIKDIGTPAQHPFNGCGLTELLPGEDEKIKPALDAAIAAAKGVMAAAEALGRNFGAAAPGDAAELEVWGGLATLCLEAPEVRGLPPIGSPWDRKETVQALASALEKGRARLALHQNYGDKLTGEAWTTDVKAARADLLTEGQSWFSRLFSGRYKAARRQIQALCNPPLPKKVDDLVATADRILESGKLRAEIEQRADACKVLVGDRWRGLESGWDDLNAVKEWALKFRALLASAKLPVGLAEWVVKAWDREALRKAQLVAQNAIAAWTSAWSRLGALLAYRGELPAQPFTAGAPRAELWKQSLGRLASYVAYGRLSQTLVRDGLKELAGLAHEGKVPPAGLRATLELAWARGILDRAFLDRPELRGFDVVLHEQTIQRFRSADSATFTVNRARLAEQHWRGLPGNIGYGQVGVLRRECAKKARHLPIRRLMEQAAVALQQSKPVFLMSPLSIAAFLPPGGPMFDLVVFDEASQVKPVDAFGAILRGRQIVVVGDEKQMPPTSFFDTLLSGEGVPEEDEETNVTQDMQSILGLCTSKGMPSRMLRWHYRSRHDSLIALSNQEFYENHLVVFPSPFRSLEGEGLNFRHLPKTVYERGTSRTNPLEADAVAEAVLEHARSRPHLTLGVVAFSQQQRTAIEDRIEKLCRKHADFDAFVNGNREEPFFVKNLENVQGDERDVMMISVGYGKDAQGGLSMNFGPLNQAGGERRLNVLITRARRQCVVFTNLLPDELDVNRAPGAGVKAFKAFLTYAKAGRLDAPRTVEAEDASEFEEQVKVALEKLGHKVDGHVGSGGYRVDLAVSDPASRERYLIGIECDGERYHGARWARDRDRLRDAVLRSLGWQLHRIWSADWHQNREEALRRCAEAIEKAKKAKAESRAAAPSGGFKRKADALPPGLEPNPAYVPAKVGANIGADRLAEVDADTLAEFISGIVEDEGPVHVEEIRRRVLEAVEARPGSRRLAAIDEGLTRSVEKALVRRRGEFLWAKAERPVVPRDRSGLPDSSRKLDYVADEECRAALARVVEEGCGCEDEEAVSQAIRILGVKRNEEARVRLLQQIAHLVQQGVVRRSGTGSLSATRPAPASVSIK